MPIAPDVPTIAESGYPGFDAVGWFGLVGPMRLPAPIVTRLNTELVRILQLPDVKERFANLGVDTIPGTPAEFGSFIKVEFAKFAKLIQDVGVKIE